MTGFVISEVVANASGPSTATVEISADEPVLRGHYPHLPIFPGVGVVECVRRGAHLTAPEDAGPLRLAALESVRWLAPVFPGDTVRIALDWRGDGAARWCTGHVSTDRGAAAVVRLRFLAGESR
ncbi:hypothetical protein [Umezawaea sp.]|uniref:hypothetical protein n=1 Tax=Umezawaea sp. TaxID=1955258 RepID=UPI002ED3012A